MDTVSKDTVPPVLETRRVLLEHLQAKIRSIKPNSSAEDLSTVVSKDLSNKEIIALLENEAQLTSKLDSSTSPAGIDKQDLGEDLFVAVSQIDTELCAQVTGMLLELNTDTINDLIKNPQLLKQAVHRAKQEYVSYANGNVKHALGEELYELVAERYPDPQVACQLTGMLLELDTDNLKILLSDMCELEEKLKVAYSALQSDKLEIMMASEEHKKLSNKIKKVHAELRCKAKEIGAEQAWAEHVSRDDSALEEYATAMLKLATEHWSKNNKDDSCLCRVQWIYNKSVEYFWKEGFVTQLEKERMFINKCPASSEINDKLYITSYPVSQEVKLLDVGSCYNPFNIFSGFYVVPIDIMPATKDVIQCDFLNVDIISNGDIHNLSNPCKELPKSSFDIIVFSLFLEYLPCPKQRWLCCNKAYELLKPNGILFVITPDSKHATANSKLLKNWRFALTYIGYCLVVQEKLKHLHCLMYRKCVSREFAHKWLLPYGLQNKDTKFYEELIQIPQDSSTFVENSMVDDSYEERNTEQNVLIADVFKSLPFF